MTEKELKDVGVKGELKIYGEPQLMSLNIWNNYVLV